MNIDTAEPPRNSKLVATRQGLPRWGYALIVVAGLLAFAGCLRADFYMDDFGFILNSKGDAAASRRLNLLPGWQITTGTPGVDSLGVSVFQLIPTSLFYLTEALVPDPSEASWLYHFWNLMFHLLTSVMVWYSGRQVLGLARLLQSDASRSNAALAAAALFACHPLCSEPIQYAKCLNSLTVAFFAMMMVGGAAEWLQKQTSRARWIAIGGMAGATFSYFPGMALAMIWGVLLLVAHWRTQALEAPRKAGISLSGKSKRTLILSFLIAGVLVIRWAPVFSNQLTRWGHLVGEHIFTQGRLFWDYLALVVAPVNLCSDYCVPWSKPWEDTAATARLILAVLLGSVSFMVLFSRRTIGMRGWALLVLMATAPLYMRFAYMNTEHFVEYRAYPAIPWCMLLITTLLYQVAERKSWVRLPVYASVVIVAIWVPLSTQRSKVWSSRETLALDAAIKYPMNPRPMTQLQAIANERGETEAVLKLHDAIMALGSQMTAFAKANPGRYYAIGRYSDAIINSSQWKVYALADRDGSAVALKFADEAIASLKGIMPRAFEGGLSGPKIADAWPLLMARDTVATHGAKIDAQRAARKDTQSPHP